MNWKWSFGWWHHYSVVCTVNCKGHQSSTFLVRVKRDKNKWVNSVRILTVLTLLKGHVYIYILGGCTTDISKCILQIISGKRIIILPLYTTSYSIIIRKKLNLLVCQLPLNLCLNLFQFDFYVSQRVLWHLPKTAQTRVLYKVQSE